MKAPHIDEERLAALLDGNLDAAERAELLARLAASDEDFRVFVETAAVLRRIEEAEAGTGPGEQDPQEGGAPDGAARVSASRPGPGAAKIHPPSMSRRRRWPSGFWAALAAVLVLAALLSVLRVRPGSPSPGDPGRMASLLEERGAGLPRGWTEHRPWGVALGTGDPLSARARAVRLGALHVDLVLAVQARDTAGSSRLAAEIVVLLDELPPAAPVADGYRDLGRRAGEAPERLAGPLEEAGRGAAELLGEDLVATGAWAEAGRIAAARQDAGFFRARESGVALRRAAELPSLPESARAAVERLRQATRGGGPPDWGTVERDLNELLRTLAS
ncbi:MAG TPA: hypothetical protein VHG28_20920 [Longimicrobiaceae bacterium]|nr:hypothetical protein [Longimicrobiaceae bacterium]